MDQCLYSRNVGQESNRKSYKDKMAIKTFRGPQERTRKETYYPRFINFKQNDLVSQVQNVDIKGSSQESSLRNVYMQHRPKGRHVPITPKLKPFLGFAYLDQLYQFRAMPFRLNITPRTFTKLIFEVTKIISKRGVWILPYLDDILIISPTREQNLLDTQITCEVLEDLGFLINIEKSRLIPAQKFQWLGIVWDIEGITSCSIPQETLQNLHSSIEMVCRPHTTRKLLMRLQGLANWIAGIDPFFKLLMAITRKLLRMTNWVRNKNSVITLPLFCRAQIKSWIHYHVVPAPLGIPDPDFHIMTDASRSGWGIVIEGKRFLGPFDPSMNYSINMKELLVVWMALLLIDQKGTSIRVLVDNTQAIYAIKKGFAKTYHLRSVAELVRKRLRSLEQTLDIRHIKGAYNVLSDQLSRNSIIATEWSLPQKVFNIMILKKFPNLEWDLFATSLNNKLPKFVSPCPDQGAAAVDAFTLNWNTLKNVFMFPPTPLISRVLEKLISTSPKGVILITRQFSARPWFARLLQISKSHFMISTKLQQVVGDKTVIQDFPTDLLVWKL